MNYEIVTLKEKIAVGVSARTNNGALDMGAVIGGLWNRFFNEGVYASVPNKADKKALGIYTDYARDEKQTIPSWQPVKSHRNRRKVPMHYAEFRQAGMQSLWFMGIWCRLLPRHGRKYGR